MMDGPPTTPFVYRKSFLVFCKEGYREKRRLLIPVHRVPGWAYQKRRLDAEKRHPQNAAAGSAAFEDFPANSNGGSDYIWDGQNLIFSPLPEESEEANAENQD